MPPSYNPHPPHSDLMDRKCGLNLWGKIMECENKELQPCFFFDSVPKCASDKMFQMPRSNSDAGDKFQWVSDANIQLLVKLPAALLAEPHILGKCCPSKVVLLVHEMK